MKSSIFLSLLVTLILAAKAQPSDAEIKKQLTTTGVLEIRFSKSPGTRQWNGDIGNWEYVRGVEIKRKSGYEGVNLIVIGDAVYQYAGAGKYSYWKFRTASNKYEGIPDPSEKEIIPVLEKNWQAFFGFYFQRIIQLHEPPSLSADPKWTWHQPTSVSFNMKLRFEWIADNTKTETVEQEFEVRLYRDALKEGWKRFIATPLAHTKRVLSEKKLPAEQIRQLEKQTLAFTLAEQKAKTQQRSAEVNIPEFRSPDELVNYLHAVLLKGDQQLFEAVMMRILAPVYFVEGSQFQLNQRGNQMIEQAVKAAFGGSLVYKDLYCPNYKLNQSLSSATHKYVLGLLPNVTTVFGTGQFHTGYVNGIAKQQWKLTELRIGVRQDPDALAFVRSFSPPERRCTEQ